MNTSANRTLHQLTLQASQVTAGGRSTAGVGGFRAGSPRPREEYSEGQLMLDPALLLNYRKQDYRHVVECHLGKKGIERIHPNTQSFVNLEVLWLNGNKLTKIDNLLPEPKEHDVADGERGCARLKRLYLQSNAITTLVGDLSRLKYLEVLLLANNKLSNMETVSQQLQHLRFLRQLDLYGNPLSEEHNYRLFVVHRHPSVTLFDNLTVSDNERREAERTFGASSRSEGSANTATTKLPRIGIGFGTTFERTTTERVGAISPSVEFLEAKVRVIRARAAAKAREEEAREETSYQRRMERRRIFHSLWGAKEPSAVSSGPGDRPGMSHLFDDDPNSAVNRLIDLAIEARAAEGEQKVSLEKKLAAMKSNLFPDRFGDKFAGALRKQRDETAAETQREYEDRVVQQLYTPEELQTLRRLYENEQLTKRDLLMMRKVLTVTLDEGLLSQYLDGYLKRHHASPTHSTSGAVSITLPSGGKQPAVEPVLLREGLVALAGFVPFVAGRIEQLCGQTSADLMRAKSGSAAQPLSAAAGNAALRRMNNLSEHVRRVEAEYREHVRGGQRNSTTDANAAELQPFAAEQARLGSTFRTVLSLHQRRASKSKALKL